MIALRREIPALRRGSLNILTTNEPFIFAYTRSLKGDKYLIVNNLSDKRCTAEIDIPADVVLKSVKDKRYVSLTNILTGEQYKLKVSIKERKTRLLLYPHAVIWLKLGNGSDNK